MLLLYNPSNRLPGLRVLVIQEEVPSLLLDGCPMDSLLRITRQYHAMLALGYRLILLLSSAGGSALPGTPFRLSVSYQASVDTPLPKVHPPGDPGSDLPGPADAQRLCEGDVDKEEGPLRVPGPPKYPPLFGSQYGHEAAPYCAIGCGVPSSRLRGYLAPTML